MGIGLANTSRKSSSWPGALFDDVLDRVGDLGGSWIGESWGCSSVVACPPSVVTKNGLSVLVRSLVIMISGVGGGW